MGRLGCFCIRLQISVRNGVVFDGMDKRRDLISLHVAQVTVLQTLKIREEVGSNPSVGSFRPGHKETRVPDCCDGKSGTIENGPGLASPALS